MWGYAWGAIKILWMLTGAMVWLAIGVLICILLWHSLEDQKTDEVYQKYVDKVKRDLDAKIKRDREEETREEEA